MSTDDGEAVVADDVPMEAASSSEDAGGTAAVSDELGEKASKRQRTVGMLDLGQFVEDRSCHYSGLDQHAIMALEAPDFEGKAEANSKGFSLVPEFEVYEARDGELLDKGAVQKAREAEIEQMQRHGMYLEVPAAAGRGGKVRSKWVDEKRVKSGIVIVRSRCVAMEFNRFAREDVNASTPPIAVVCAVISMAASKRPRGQRLLGVYDVSVAFFHADIDEDIQVTPPFSASVDGMTWQLQKAMYGTRRAGQLWQEFLASVFESNGWTRIIVAAGVYYEPRLDITCVIHGDDFLAEGEAETLVVFDAQLQAAMDVKILAKVGAGAATSGRYLKRTIEWDGRAFYWKPDGKHVARLIEMLGLTGAKPSDTPGTKATAASMRDALEPLTGANLALFPQAAELVNYIAVDRPDIQYSVKNVLADMHAPCQRSMARLKRIGRYLIDRSALAWMYKVQETPGRVMYQSDSDWGDDKETRKSSTCTLGYFGAHLLETQVAMQAVVALSSGEAEFYALGRAAASAIMMRQVFEQCGFVGMEAIVQSDSSAARGIASRIGSGRPRHLHIRDLWIQEKTRSGEIKLERARTEDNTSDLGTEYLDRKRIDKLMGLAGLVFEKVKPAGARVLAAVTMLGCPLAVAGAVPADNDDEHENEYVFMALMITMIVGMTTIVVKIQSVAAYATRECRRREIGSLKKNATRSRGALAARRAAYESR